MTGIPYRIAIPPRPTGGDYAAVPAADLARAEVLRADEVRLGDTILADFPGLHLPGGDGLVLAEHFTDPYWATPQLADPGCTCLPCQGAAWTAADGPLIRLADGFPWDGCDVQPASALLLVTRYRCACGCNTALADDWSDYDWASPASVQHLLETGRPLRPGEILRLSTSQPRDARRVRSTHPPTTTPGRRDGGSGTCTSPTRSSMTTLPTEQQLAEIEAREAAATAGPWGVYESGGLIEIAADLQETGHGYRARRGIARLDEEPLDNDPAHRERTAEEDWAQVQADAVFVGHAREDVRTLLALVRRLQTQRNFLLDQVKKKDAESGAGDRALAAFLTSGPEQADQAVESTDPGESEAR